LRFQSPGPAQPAISFIKAPLRLSLLKLLLLTIRRLAEILQVSVRAATQAISQLMKGGMLTERTGYARNRTFAAPEALSIINRPFGEDSILPVRQETAE
jgi:DNA-binding transcriptional MocR family regulator